MTILQNELEKAARQSERIENQAIRQLKGIYKQSEDVILNLIGQNMRKYAPEEMNKYGRMEALERDIYKELGTMTQRERNLINAAIAAAYLSAYGRTAFGIEAEVQAKLAYREPLVRSAGKGARTAIEVLQQRDFKNLAIQRTTALTRMQIQRDLVAGMAQGEGYREIAKKVHQTLLREDADSALYRAARITRTECGIARSIAQHESADHAFKMGIVMRKSWIATIDTRTRDAHGVLDGVEVAYDDDFESPAGGSGFGPREMGNAADDIQCRCSLRFIVDEDAPSVRRIRGEGIVRDSKGKIIEKNVVPYRTYSEYAKEKGWKNKYKDFNL